MLQCFSYFIAMCYTSTSYICFVILVGWFCSNFYPRDDAFAFKPNSSTVKIVTRMHLKSPFWDPESKKKILGRGHRSSSGELTPLPRRTPSMPAALQSSHELGALSLPPFVNPESATVTQTDIHVNLCLIGLAVWCSGNALVSINAVALHRARLVLGWTTAFGQVNCLIT